MSFDLVTFGETLVRLSPEGPRVLEQAHNLNVYPAGSELNVAVAAKRLGLSVAYVTKLAENPLGHLIENRCREHGIDTRWISWCNKHRQGLYFFENCSTPRSGVAYYDRLNSAFSNVKESDFDWTDIMSETRVFMTSGINPALSRSAHEITIQAVRCAKEMGKIIAFDINYRSKLWSRNKAADVISQYLQYVDILFTSADDALEILGYQDPASEELANKISKQLSIPTVCLIFKPEHSSSALWRIACASNGKTFTADQQGGLITVDRLGAGDAFAGGFLKGYLEEGPERGVKMGNAMMTLANTYQGDFSWATRAQVEDLLAGRARLLER